MSLHGGIDTVAIASFGVYSDTYGDGEGGSIATLFVSRGLMEEASESIFVSGGLGMGMSLDESFYGQ